ncbi:hypothetical protein N431DRAFT_431012 [Stipitochalara longipes BDJ]|nr:hypothetical protein N431DRAFT_431012 [Stipitochalara longipes BDJ]
MRKQLVITKNPIPIDNVQLGGLIPTYLHPALEAVAPLKPVLTDINESPQTAYKSLIKNYRKTALSPHLAIFGFDVSRDEDVDVIIEATHGMQYELKDATRWFKKLCADTEVQEWIQKRARARKDMFLVTGYRTFSDARITHTAKHGRGIGGNVTVPADAIASAAGTGIPISLGMDVGMEGKIEKSRKVEGEYTAPGEQIYAIQYRRVEVGWFSSSSVDAASLEEKVNWEDVFTNMGEENENDMVEAELATTLRLGVETEISLDEGCEDEYLIVQEDEF